MSLATADSTYDNSSGEPEDYNAEGYFADTDREAVAGGRGD